MSEIENAPSAEEEAVEAPVEEIVEAPIVEEVAVEAVAEEIVEAPMVGEVAVEAPVEEIVEETAEAPMVGEVAVEAPVEEIVEEIVEAPMVEEVAVEAPVEEIVEETVEAPMVGEVAVEAPVEEFVEEIVEAPMVGEVAVEAPDEEFVQALAPAPGRVAISPPSLDHLPDDVIDFEAAIAATVLEFREGDIVEGTVVSVDQDGAMIDIGYKSEGLIPTQELSIRNNIDPGSVVKVGERVEALVLNKEDDEGRLILSKKRAQYERAWGRIQQITDSGETVKGTVIEVVKGGLIVDIGLRGFLPASLVDLRRVRDLDPFVGTEIEAKVIELDRNRNNVVLSRRAYLEEEQQEQRQAFLDDLAEGEDRDGVVSSVVNFGAFVDLGGMDGLVHVSELSWQHVNHPSEVVKVGDNVRIKVLEVDRERERISLSIRQTLEDPWVVFARDNEVGSVVEGEVIKTVPFGAFVSVAEGVEGLVHVSEIAVHRVESPELELSIGQKVQAKITELDEEKRRVSLSMKQAMPDWKEREAVVSQPKRRPPRREFEREFGPEEPERPPVSVDASLEAILQELKERGIGRR